MYYENEYRFYGGMSVTGYVYKSSLGTDHKLYSVTNGLVLLGAHSVLQQSLVYALGVTMLAHAVFM